MSSIIISSANPLIKMARSLRQKKARDDSELFLVEGILHVGEAAEAGWKIDALLYCPERLRSEFGRKLVDDLEQKGVNCHPVSVSAFDSFSEKENPQGIAALIRQKHRTLNDIAPFDFAVAVVSPQDPGNVGTILRTIDAVDANALILIDGGADPYHPTTVRASMGAIFWKPFYTVNFQDFSNFVRNGKMRVIGTSAHATVDFRKFILDNRPSILLLGSEQKGLIPEQLAICDDLIALPMHGRASSLNLSVAAGILLYALKG